MSTIGFRARLANRQEEVKSLACVGLDPLVKNVPESVRRHCRTDADAVFIHMREIVDATAPHTSTFKLQRAYWEAIPGGTDAMRLLIAHIHFAHPEIPVTLDCKRGDIDRTQGQYAYAHFELDGVDAMNYNGYMGRDTLKSLIDPNNMGRGLIGLGRTSNPEAWEVQDIILENGKCYWEFMVQRLLAWSTEFGVLENAGIVMGAAHADQVNRDAVYSAHLSRAREIVGDKMWFLIPGFGKQGGLVRETVRAAWRGWGSIVVSSSSGIIFASKGDDFAEASARKAQELQLEGNNSLAA